MLGDLLRRMGVRKGRGTRRHGCTGAGWHRPSPPALRLEILEDRTVPSSDFRFGFAVGGTISDQGRGIATDSAGNVYIAGSFEDTADFDPGPGSSELTSQGSFDMVVAKYSTNGVLLWARSMGGSDGDNGRAIAVDGSGNVYTTGEFS